MLGIATLTFTSAFDLKSDCAIAAAEWLSGMGSHSPGSLSIHERHKGKFP